MLLKQIQNHAEKLIRKITQEAKRPTIIVGLSGGPDSVFLLHMLNKMRESNTIDIVAAHLDHQWRQESGTDAQFCQQLCTQLNIPLVTSTASSLDCSIHYNGSKEELGRKLRRHFFEQTRIALNAHAIALAHHADDQQETFFLRLIRGTTLNGIHGMNETEGLYLRPLLQIYKQDILDYLHQEKIDYLVDQTNTSDEFLRNRIRNHLIPALKSCDGRFADKFGSTLQHLKAEDAFLQKLASQSYENIFSYNQQQLTGNLNLFRALDPTLQRRVILQWLVATKVAFSPSSALLFEIIRFLNSDRGGAHAITPTASIFKKQSTFWICN